jgi:hypothetical protein
MGTRTMVLEYHGNVSWIMLYLCTTCDIECDSSTLLVHVYHGTAIRSIDNIAIPWYHLVRVPLVPWYTCTSYVQVRTGIRTNSQKRLEIQACRCPGETSGRCQHRRHHSILRLLQLDSDVCSADLHHNPRKHVGLHAHQRLHRLSGRPRLRVPRAVVLAGHLLAWLGSRQSVEPVTGRFVDASTRLQDKRDEVVLVGVLRRFDRGVGLRRSA